jgi:hypothetical protein
MANTMNIPKEGRGEVVIKLILDKTPNKSNMEKL